MQERSLVRQVVTIVLSAQILCALVLSFVALQHERSSRLRAFDVRIQGRSDSLLGAIQDAEDPADNVTIDPRELRLPTDDVFAVYNGDGRSLGTSPGAPQELTTRAGNGFRDIPVSGTRYRVYQREAMRIIDRAEFGGVGLTRPVTILYASPENHLWHEVLEAARFYLAAIFVVALVTGVWVAQLLRKVMRPLSELTGAACQIAAPTLQFSPPPSVFHVRELKPLAEVLTSAVSGLREAFEREQRFVGDAAHELKTAVAVVRSTVQVLMMRRRTTEEYAGGLERVLEDNSRVENLVAQMLQLARVQHPPANEVPPLDLGQAVTAAVDQLDSTAHMRGITLRCQIERLQMVRIQPQRAAILVANLVQNAIQHSDAGTSINTSVRAEGVSIILEVRDSGTGIHADALLHVFDRFYREDESRSRETGGAGLGLAICKSIVEAAGATIAIESEQGEGTVVIVTFIQA